VEEIEAAHPDCVNGTAECFLNWSNVSAAGDADEHEGRSLVITRSSGQTLLLRPPACNLTILYVQQVSTGVDASALLAFSIGPATVTVLLTPSMAAARVSMLCGRRFETGIVHASSVRLQSSAGEVTEADRTGGCIVAESSGNLVTRPDGASWRSASGATRCRCDRASVVCLPFSSVQRQVETDQAGLSPVEISLIVVSLVIVAGVLCAFSIFRIRKRRAEATPIRRVLRLEMAAPGAHASDSRLRPAMDNE